MNVGMHWHAVQLAALLQPTFLGGVHLLPAGPHVFVHLPPDLLHVSFLVVVPGPVEANVLEPELGTTRMAAAKAEIPALVNTSATFFQMLRMIRSSIGPSATPLFASSGGCLL